MYKKAVVCSLLVGMIAGFSLGVMYNSADYRIYNLKRKLKSIERKLNREVKNLGKDYKEQLVSEYEMIKDKIDSITIKDIKDKGNEIITGISDSINNLKQKLCECNK